MLAKITLYDGTVYKIASATTDTQDGIYLGRIKDELQLVSQMQEAGNAPTTVNLTIINHDNFIPRTKDLWAAELLLTNDNNVSWRGKINFCNFDADGNLYVTASEKTAPELELQLPDEVRQVYTVDEDFHQSSVTMTIPLVIGGTHEKPILVPTILIDKTQGIYLICVGEIREVVNVYSGSEKLPQWEYNSWRGTAEQPYHKGFAYVTIGYNKRFNADGSYAEINVEVVGLKLGDFTEEECRNGALFLYYFLTTADTGVNGWGCGIDQSEIDTASFQSAITLCNQLGYKLDGIMWLRQSAQSWIDQICQAIHGKYSINANGKRSLFIDYAGNASKKTFTASNMQVERYGKNSYTSVVYNKGVLSYDYNPITGLFMQSAQYENSDSIAQIGEQKFIGESYLIKDATTALAVLEYTCKRSQIAAEAIEFKTDDVETNLRAGDIITINRPDLNLNNALYQIQSISTTDFISNIIAVKFDTSVFSVTGTASTVNWGNERDITPALTPAQATNLLLSTGFDINPDGTGIPYISGTFTVPDGGWLAAAVQYGIGTNPSNWTEMALITEGRFKLSPVNVDTVYSIRVRMITATGHSSFITGVITATGDTTPPGKPTISAKATDRTVTIQCGLDNPPSDMGGFQIYRKKSTDSESAYTYIGSIAANRGYAAFSDYVDEYVTYNYKAKSYDRSGNLSTQFSDVANVTITGVEAVELAASAIAMPTGSILRLSAKNCTTASIAETNGVKDCSGRGNHGRAYNGVQVVTDNEKGDCFSFDGTDDYIITKKITITADITLGILVNFSNINRYPFMVDIRNSSNTDGVALSVYNNRPRLSSRKTDNRWDLDSNYALSTNQWYYVVGVIDSTNNKVKLFVNGVKIAEGEQNNTSTLNTEVYVSRAADQAASDYRINGKVADVRVFPRALSDTEVKSMFMIPDEAIFGQLTTDMFGANIIHAGYILNDGDFQTLAINAVNANINNLNIAGNATFKAHFGTCTTEAATAAKTVNITGFSLFAGAEVQIKFSYKNTATNPTLNINGTGAKAIYAQGIRISGGSRFNWEDGDIVFLVYDGTNYNLINQSVASNIYYTGTTQIDGGVIRTRTIQANSLVANSVTADELAANSITAEKLTVGAVKKPYGCAYELNFGGIPAGALSADFQIPDSSGGQFVLLAKNSPTIVDGSVAGRNIDFANTGAHLISKTAFPVNGVMSYSFWFYFTALPDSGSAFDVIVDHRKTGNTAGCFIGLTTSGSIRYASRASSNTWTKDTTTTLAINTWYNVTVTFGSSTSKVYLNGALIDSYSGHLTANTSECYLRIAREVAQQAQYDFKGKLALLRIYKKELTATEAKTLYMMGIEHESGTITADRIATDAIKSRNYAYSSGLYSTAGTFLDLANGQIISKNFSIDSSGNATFKGALSGATGSFSGSVTATSGKIGDFTISNGILTYSGSKYSQTSGIISVTSTYGSITDVATLSGSMIQFTRSSVGQVGTFYAGYMGVSYNNYARYASFTASGGGSSGDYGGAIGVIQAANSNCFGLYVIGKIRANSTDYGSDEKTKKDFKAVNVLDKLKGLNVCAWRFDEEKLIEKQNKDIDKRNLEIEAENKIIEAENIEIDKQNLLLMAKKSKSTEEEIKLIERKPLKKLREHRIADKTVRHPLNIGCMAGEFNKAFGTNDGSEDCLSVTDTIGVCMRAIQELAEISDAQKAEIAELKAQLKIQQDEKSDVEQESSYTEKSDNSKDADNLDFPDVGKIQKINKKDKSNEKTCNNAVSVNNSSNN